LDEEKRIKDKGGRCAEGGGCGDFLVGEEVAGLKGEFVILACVYWVLAVPL